MPTHEKGRASAEDATRMQQTHAAESSADLRLAEGVDAEPFGLAAILRAKGTARWISDYDSELALQALGGQP
jgi:hypothetical protein